MACVNADGTLTVIARQVLNALLTPGTVIDINQRTGVPAYRIRSSVRELSNMGLMAEEAGQYTITEQGRAMLAKF